MREKTKKKSELTVQEAVENLSLLAQIDPKDPYRLGIVKGFKFVRQEGSAEYTAIEWLTSEGAEEVQDVVKKTYQRVLNYLEELYEDKGTDWENPKTRKGLQAIMVSVGEAAANLDQIMKQIEPKLRPHNITFSKEYQDLQEFYLTQLQKKFAYPLEGKGDWEEEIELNPQDSGLKDFETIRNDREYELFYLVNEDGKPYFSSQLLRNIKLVCDFDESMTAPFEEDPLLRIRTMQDRDLSSAASQILMGAKALLQEFYKQKIRLKEMILIQSLGKAIMALMLAANQRNLIQNTLNKSCLEYFQDFEDFLNEALQSSEYMKWIAYPPDQKDRTAYLLLDLVHVFCKWNFLRHLGIKQEIDGFIHRLIRKGEEMLKKEKKVPEKKGFWDGFLVEDSLIRKLLSYYPSGPLFKVLDILRKEEETFFEPLRQGNHPHALFEMTMGKKEINFLHLPSPTKQRVVSKADISEEFRGFLRSYLFHRPCSKHLLVNLQDRTSWKEHIRCQTLESLQKQAEFSSCLFVITLSKDTDFYHQTGSYIEQSQAEAFLKLTLEHIKQAEDYGFFLPSSLKTPVFFAFAEDLLAKIHEVFFQKSKELSRADRLDFIEIFYHFLVLKIIETLDPDSVSFSCKDAVDTGACAHASLYAFLHYLSGEKMEKEQQEYLRVLFYTPSLLVRERAVDPERCNRVVSALARMDAMTQKDSQKLQKAFGPLFTSNLKQMKINEHLH